jgi:hypothetical protein
MAYGGYGLGWNVRQLDKYPVFQHSGGMPGVSTFIQFAPKANIGVYAASNCDDHLFTAYLNTWILATLLDTEESTEIAKRFEKNLLDIPKDAMVSINEAFEDVQGEDLVIDERFEDFVGIYHHKAYGKVEISKASEPGHLEIYRSPYKTTLFPNYNDSTKFYTKMNGIELATEWGFKISNGIIELYLEETPELHIPFGRLE